MTQEYERWHMSKNIPIITLIGLIFSTVSVIITITWGASALNGEIQQNKRNIQDNQRRTENVRMESVQEREKIRNNIVRMEQQTSVQAVSIGKIEVGVESIQRSLDGLSRKLENAQ